MTLEKLLIFAFALAVFSALVVSATTLMKDSSSSNSTYEEHVKTTVDKATK
jgi:hypothetical protein